MKAYMVANLDFFRSAWAQSWGKPELGASLPKPAGARVEQAGALDPSGMAPPLASRRASAT
jgi:hypothetical protein